MGILRLKKVPLTIHFIFHNYPIDIDNVDIKIYWYLTNFHIAKKSFKCFVGYIYGYTIKPLCIKLPKLSRYSEYFNETKH